MERPCFQGESHLNPRNNFSWIMTDHLRDEDVLSIAGEEDVARSYFNQAQSRLAHLSQVHSKIEIIAKKLSYIISKKKELDYKNFFIRFSEETL